MTGSEMPKAEEITERIRALKKERRLTAGVLAKRVTEITGERMSLNTMNGILGGKRSAYSVGDIIAFARALEVQPSDLVPELVPPDPALRDRYRKELIADLVRMP